MNWSLKSRDKAASHRLALRQIRVGREETDG